MPQLRLLRNLVDPESIARRRLIEAANLCRKLQRNGSTPAKQERRRARLDELRGQLRTRDRERVQDPSIRAMLES